MIFKDKIINYTDIIKKKEFNNDEKLYETNYMKTYNNHFINSKNNYLLLIGPSGSGKTTTIIEFINRCIYDNKKKFIPFSSIYYFTGSTSDETLINYLKNIIDDGLYVIDDINNIPSIYDFKDDYKNDKKIMIFDDINNLNKKQQEIINQWSNSGRKLFSHIFFIAQNMNIPTNIRRNINYIFIYKQRQNYIINKIINDYNLYNIDKDILKNIYLDCTKNKGDFLMLDLTDNTKYPIRHNFIDVYNIDDLLKNK